MADCELVGGCLFFNDKMKDTEGLGSLYKKKYCIGDNSECARYMVAKALGRPAVPTTLYPNMTDKANNLILEAETASA